jgi:hypothetical protein
VSIKAGVPSPRWRAFFTHCKPEPSGNCQSTSQASNGSPRSAVVCAKLAHQSTTWPWLRK